MFLKFLIVCYSPKTLSDIRNIYITNFCTFATSIYNTKMSKKYPTYGGLNMPNVAEVVLERWKKENIFQKSVDTREGKTPFSFTEGPPSANGLPGIHHVMARSVKDIFCRYKTLKGFQVKRKAGWDTHGLPVELKVEK
jgi:isoleucyl-tRNA synthetase